MGRPLRPRASDTSERTHDVVVAVVVAVAVAVDVDVDVDE